MLQGTLRVELADGKSRDFQAGEAFAEAVSTRHRGLNVGTVPVRLVAFYVGERGTPISVATPAPNAAKK